MYRISTVIILAYLSTLSDRVVAAPCLENSISANSTTQGTLSTSDCRVSDALAFDDDSFTDLYVFTLSTNTEMTINLSSTDFDSFLRLLSDQSVVLLEDDDSGNNFDATITTTLTPGSYKILTNSATNLEQTGSYTLTLNASNQAQESTRLINIATRGMVGTGDNVLIGGMVIQGTESKTILIRARGPALAEAGVGGALADPNVFLFSGATLIDQNDDWTEHQNMDLIPSNLKPSDSRESVIVKTLAPGAYTAIVTGINGEEGIGLIEVFELGDTEETRLINIATRGFVGVDDSVMIAGLVITGTGLEKVVLRAKGPSLTALGVDGALLDPQLFLFSGTTIIDSNNNWQDHPEMLNIPENLRPTEDLEAVIYRELAPGAYTAIVTGTANTTGVSIVEVFEIE